MRFWTIKRSSSSSFWTELTKTFSSGIATPRCYTSNPSPFESLRILLCPRISSAAHQSVSSAHLATCTPAPQTKTPLGRCPGLRSIWSTKRVNELVTVSYILSAA